ncbi:PREDICTED: Fanconi anemia group F protein [Tinamus guttatus]|uniref:Fanconi anemia group F protein n=1 Tax=Tinamus guttatus TaxID=94827 RepID=UPI00052EAEB7|nr:PREDICTED: Fanconi anemia group F protein [Tinamus guttatus]
MLTHFADLESTSPSPAPRFAWVSPPPPYIRTDTHAQTCRKGREGKIYERLPLRATEVVATALLLGDEEGPRGERGDGQAAAALLAWLLQSPERLSALCRLLPGSLLAALATRYSQLSASYLDLLVAWGSRLLYDPLQGRWGSSCFEQAELSWAELRERFDCLCRAPAPLGAQTRAALELLKVQDGDFDVPGVSVWTDLLAEVEKSLRKAVKPRADLKLLKAKKTV